MLLQQYTVTRIDGSVASQCSSIYPHTSGEHRAVRSHSLAEILPCSTSSSLATASSNDSVIVSCFCSLCLWCDAIRSDLLHATVRGRVGPRQCAAITVFLSVLLHGFASSVGSLLQCASYAFEVVL